ncbi:MAG: CrcB family protein [Bifidobacteriaceae bacterium]|jgi:CrcB protein|nr:CrcB family protein [Bifidobacteriaceae bacterium]
MNSTIAFLLLSLCGGLGAVCRFEVDSVVNKHNRLKFPLGTIVVNVTACFLLGLLTGIVATHVSPAATAAAVKLILGTGFLGGYSTFSTASVEGFRQLQMGHYGYALLHTGGMLVLSLIAGLIGVTIV